MSQIRSVEYWPRERTEYDRGSLQLPFLLCDLTSERIVDPVWKMDLHNAFDIDSLYSLNPLRDAHKMWLVEYSPTINDYLEVWYNW